MNLRNFIEKLDAEKKLVRIKKEVSTDFEIANLLAALDGKVVLFEKVKGSEFPVVGNLVSSRDLVASALGIQKEKMLEKMAYAINNRKEPEVIKQRSLPGGRGRARFEQITNPEIHAKRRWQVHRLCRLHDKGP